jgi:hypothetical protein
VTFGEVLMVGGEAGTVVGAPMIEGASVAGEVVEQTRGDKVIVFKKRAPQEFAPPATVIASGSPSCASPASCRAPRRTPEVGKRVGIGELHGSQESRRFVA